MIALHSDDEYDGPEIEAIPCPSCGGNPSEDECFTCNGDGWVEVEI